MTGEHRPAEGRFTHAEVEVPGSPEAVWAAIASGAGISAWLFPAEVDGGVGGAVVIDRGRYGGPAPATVTAWEPPRRFAYEESLPVADGAPGPPLATEFLIDSRDGTSCVVRVVSGLHDDTEGWEPLIDGAGQGWRIALQILRSYLTHFGHLARHPAGAAGIDASVPVERPLSGRAASFTAALHLLGLAGRGEGAAFHTPPGVPELAGTVAHVDPAFVVLRVIVPAPGLFTVSTQPMAGAAQVSVNVGGRLYGPDASSVAAREQRRWDRWLHGHRARLAATP